MSGACLRGGLVSICRRENDRHSNSLPFLFLESTRAIVFIDERKTRKHEEVHGLPTLMRPKASCFHWNFQRKERRALDSNNESQSTSARDKVRRGKVVCWNQITRRFPLELIYVFVTFTPARNDPFSQSLSEACLKTVQCKQKPRESERGKSIESNNSSVEICRQNQ